jgi:hypothetical protein
MLCIVLALVVTLVSVVFQLAVAFIGGTVYGAMWLFDNRTTPDVGSGHLTSNNHIISTIIVTYLIWGLILWV